MGENPSGQDVCQIIDEIIPQLSPDLFLVFQDSPSNLLLVSILLDTTESFARRYGKSNTRKRREPLDQKTNSERYSEKGFALWTKMVKRKGTISNHEE